MKPSSKRVLGVIIIVFSTIAAAIVVCQVFPYTFDDFPCIVDENSLSDIHSDTRIAYCIREWPLLEAKSRGKIYGHGSSNHDEVRVGDLEFRRDGHALFINGRIIASGGFYKSIHWKPSINPWIILIYRYEIRNYGLVTSTETIDNVDVLYASGDVYNSWFINPLGFIILGYGIWLFRQGKQEMKKYPKLQLGQVENALPLLEGCRNDIWGLIRILLTSQRD